MSEAQGAVGTGEAEQTTQPQQEPKLSPLQEAVRKGLQVPEDIAPAPKEEPKPKDEPEEQPEEQPEEEPAEEPAEGPQEETPATEEAEHEEEVPEDWPKTAKARVAEEAKKRRDRTTERDQWKATAEKLYAQLQQAPGPQLQPTTRLNEVVDRQSLETAEDHWKQIRRFARTHPDGADDVLIGKDAEGNEVRRDYSREEIIQMGLDADEAFESLPQKRAFVEESERKTEVAKKVYPDLFKDTEIGREAAQLVRRAPWILQSAEWALDVGDYLTGRRTRLAKHVGKNGKPISKEAQAILGAPKVAKAPGVIRSRAPSGGPGRGTGGVDRVDQKQANEEFYAAGGTSEALEARIKRKLAVAEQERAGGKQAALV